MKLIIFIFLGFFAFSIGYSIEDREFALSQTIRPCDNFYQYVCESEIKKFKLPPQHSRYTFHFTDAYENFLSTTASFLKTLQSSTKLSSRSEKILQYYLSCNNKEFRKKEEIQETNKIIAEIQSLKSRSQFLKYTAEEIKQRRLGWISLDTDAHTQDPKSWRIDIYANWMSLPEKSYYDNKEVTEGLSNLMVLLFQTVKLDSAKERAQRVLDLEKRFASNNLTAAQLDERWVIPEYWTQKQFLRQFPIISEQVDLSSVPKKWSIHKYTPELYKFTENALKNEDLETLKDYLIFRLVHYTLDFSNPEWEQTYRKFRHQHLGFPAERRPLDEECTRLVQSEMGEELAAEMILTVYKSYPRKEFTALVEKVRHSLLLGIKNNPWMESQSRSHASAKIKNLRLGLLYPTKKEDWRFPPEKNFSVEHFIQNRTLRQKALQERTFAELKKPRSLTAWSLTPMAFDAYYYRAENRFYFPVGFAMKPIYDPEKSELFNIASMGSLIGHELGHSLDKFGSQYNEFGAKRPLFTEKDQKKFEEFSQRFIKQFEHADHDGNLTLTENIADHIGLIASYEAAFPEKTKDSLELQKLFFINYAKNWCTAMTPEYKKSHLKEDTHSLPESRVNEQVKHLNGFYEAFQCPAGSKMHLPESERIRIF